MAKKYYDEEMYSGCSSEGSETFLSNCHGWALGGACSHTKYGNLFGTSNSCDILHADNCTEQTTFCVNAEGYKPAHSIVVTKVECCKCAECGSEGELWITETKEKFNASRIYITTYDVEDHVDLPGASSWWLDDG